MYEHILLMFYKRAQVLVVLEKWFCIFIIKISQQVCGHLAKFFLQMLFPT